jgi:hypothetical protein
MAVDVSVMLRNALRKLETDRNRFDKQLSAIRAALGGMNSGGPRRRRPRMSAAQRAAVSKRMKAFWVKKRAAAKAAQTKKTPKKQATSAARPKKGAPKKQAATASNATTGAK